jgi:hypothetical protein
MFLHSGASLHGHEYSNRPAATNAQTVQRRSPLIRAAFGTTPVTRLSPPIAPKPALRTRPVSEYVPRSTEQIVRFQEPLSEPELDPEPEAEPEPEPVVRVVSASAMSEDESAFSASELSDASQSTEKKVRRKRKRVPRSSTTYLLAVPPPRPGPKTVLFQHIRPRPLLQLQQLSADSRPRPAIDVCPSSMINASVTTLLSRKFPKIVGRRGRLGLDDLVLLKSEEYESAAREETAEGAAQKLTGRALVAVLSPVKQQDRAEVVLDDGSVWVATLQRNGNYDFAHEDDLGNTTLARWVRRAVTIPSAAATEAAATGTASPPVPEYKYTFSIINPLSRRHPVMASLTSTALDIQDSYTTVSSSYGRYPPSRAFGRVNSPANTPGGIISSPSKPASSVQRNAYSDDEGDGLSLPSPAPERTTIPIDDAMKNMISVTAVWVALRSGWSPYYRAPTSDVGARHESGSTASGAITAANTNALHGGRIGFSRSGTWDGTERRNFSETGTNTATTQPRPVSISGTSTVRDRSVTLSHVRIGSTDQSSINPLPHVGVQSIATHPGATVPSQSLGAARSTPQRVMSTGAAFMQRRREQQQQQAHASDASDSERATPLSARRRGRFPRLLSGDRSSTGAVLASQTPTSQSFGNSAGNTYQVQRMATHEVNQEPVVLTPLTPPTIALPEPASYSFTSTPEPARRSGSTIVISRARVNEIGRSNSTSAAAGQLARGHRKVNSMAYTVVSPTTSTGDAWDAPNCDLESSEVSLNSSLPNALHNLPRLEIADGEPKAAGASRFRAFGNWFRKLGAH